MRSLFLSIILAILIFPQAGSADKSGPDDPYKALVIIDRKNDAHLDFIGSINNRLKNEPQKRIVTIVYTIAEIKQFLQKNNRMPDANIIIPVGNEAALSIKEYSVKIPVYFTLITSNAYEMIEHDLSKNDFIHSEISGLYVNHPITKHLTFIHYALPELNEACMITSHFHISKNTPYAMKLSLDIINNEEDLHNLLPDILSQCDVLLASLDPVIYNNESIRNILITAYRYKTPVIGHSKAFVKAGALMGLYTSPQQLGVEVSEILISLSGKKTQPLPEPKPPKYFSIEYNYFVAQALGLSLPDKEELITRLKKDFDKKQ